MADILHDLVESEASLALLRMKQAEADTRAEFGGGLDFTWQILQLQNEANWLRGLLAKQAVGAVTN